MQPVRLCGAEPYTVAIQGHLMNRAQCAKTNLVASDMQPVRLYKAEPYTVRPYKAEPYTVRPYKAEPYTVRLYKALHVLHSCNRSHRKEKL